MNNQGNRGRLKHVLFAALAAIALGLPAAFLLQTQENQDVVIAEQTATPSQHQVGSSRWLLEQLELPDSHAARAAEAADDPKAFDQVLLDYFRTKPAMKGIPVGYIRHGQVVENYHKGIFQIGQNEPVPFALPFDWAREDRGANFVAELHSWRYLTNFLDGYLAEKNPLYIKVLDQIVFDWIEKNPREKPSHKRAWHEGAVAKRIVVLVNLIDKYEQYADATNVPLSTLLSLLHEHILFLTDNSHYRAQGNHGIRQDLGVLAATILVPEFRQSKPWQQFVLDRLRTQQIDSGFSVEGVWKEHSPGYHVYVMRLFEDVMTLTRENELKADLGFLHKLDAKSQRYLSHVLTPQGLQPPVGDTAEKGVSPDLINSPEARYTATQGKEGTPPKELDGFFPDAGEAIFRDTWGDASRPAKDALYVNFRAPDHPGFGHRHEDPLSVVFAGLGRWWIIEAGKYGYDMNHWRKYIESAQGHNGYTFNGRALDALDRRDENRTAVMELHGVFTPQFAAARATANRFKGEARATRTAVLLRDRKTLVLLDRLRSAETGDWQGYFHLAPDLKVDVAGARAVASAQSHPDVRLEIATETSKTGSAELVTGQQDPVQGWYSPEFLKMEPTPTLIVHRRGDDLTVATVIRLADQSQPPVSDLQSTDSSNATTVNWREGDQSVHLTIGKSQPLTVELK